MTAFNTFGWDASAVLLPMNRSQAVIEFDQRGTILEANDRMTQENAAMSDRTTQIGSTLADGASSLMRLVNQFKLNWRTVQRELGLEMTATAMSSRRAVISKGLRVAHGNAAIKHEQWADF